jgi:RNA polymerase sigma factor (sigma-70 family)
MNQPRVDILMQFVRHLQSGDASESESDRELLRRYASDHDEAAFASIVRRHKSLVWAVCKRALRHQDAEDVFQATFLVLARKAGVIQWQQSVGPWLHAVATRLARKIRTETRDRSLLHDQALSQPSPLDEMSARELLVALDEELAGLPQRYREPLVLCLLEGKTQDEAARFLGTSLSTLRRNLQRGRDRLHARLTRRGLSLSSASAAVLAHATGSAAAPAVLAGAGQGVGLSPRVLALAQSLLKTSFTRFQVVLSLLLVLGVTAAGFGLAAKQPPADTPNPSAKEETPAAVAVREGKRLDAQGDPLPAGVRARLGTTRFRQGGWINSLAWSPDGKLLATGGDDRSICLWDATGRCVRRLYGHKRSCQHVLFSPDGKLLASLGWEEEAIILWDMASGKEVRRLSGHKRTHGVAFSPDSKTLASTGGDGAVLWDVGTGKIVRRLLDGPKVFCAIAYAPDGKTLAAGGQDGSLRLWEAATGKQVRFLRQPDSGVRLPGISSVGAITFSRDGKRLASGQMNGRASVWDLVANKLLQEWTGHKGYICTVDFSPDGKTLAISSYRTFDFRAPPSIRLYDVTTGRESVTLEASWGAMNGVAFSPDGKVLAAADSNAVRRWTVATGRELPPRAAHHGAVSSVAVSPNGKIIYSASQDARVRAWDAATGKELFCLTKHDSPVFWLCLTPDGKVLATGDGDSRVHLQDAVTGKHRRKFEPPASISRPLAFTPDGQSLITTGEDKKLRFWNIDTDKEVRCISMGGRTFCLAFTPDGGTIATGGDADGYQVMRLVDVPTGRVTPGPRALHRIAAVAFSPDGRWLASALGGEANLVRLHAMPSGKEVRQFRGHSGGVVAVAFSPDGRTLASASHDGTVRLWEAVTGQERRELGGHHGEVHTLAFSPDGRSLISGGADTAVLIWNLDDPMLAHRRGKAPTPAQLEQMWKDLAGTDAARAWDAICHLTAFPEQAVPLLRQRLRKLPPMAVGITERIRDLDDDDFHVRERATEELKKLGRLVEQELREERAVTKSLEARRRLDRLLGGLSEPSDSSVPTEEPRLLRALEVLERAGTPAARETLKALAANKTVPSLSRAATDALKRLERRR